MELPIPDFESGASAIPPLRRYLNQLRLCRRIRRLVEANSVGKVMRLCEGSKFGCETAKSSQIVSSAHQCLQNSIIIDDRYVNICDTVDVGDGLGYFWGRISKLNSEEDLNMKLGLINSAWAQAGRDTSWGIQKTHEIGFDCIDIFTDPLDIDVRERQLIRRECRKANLPIVSVCCVATGLLDFNPSVQRFHIERCKKFLDLCYEFEADNLLLVLGEYIWNQEVIPPAEQWKTGIENCRRLADYAASLGLRIALELEPFQLSIVNNVENMVRFLEDANHPALCANIDVSHLQLANVKPAEVSRLKDLAIHAHISDCDGVRHGDLPPGRGVVNFEGYLQEIAKLEMGGTMSIELEYSPEPDRVEDWVREAFTATAALMKNAGLRE